MRNLTHYFLPPQEVGIEAKVPPQTHSQLYFSTFCTSNAAFFDVIFKEKQLFILSKEKGGKNNTFFLTSNQVPTI